MTSCGEYTGCLIIKCQKILYSPDCEFIEVIRQVIINILKVKTFNLNITLQLLK